MGQVLANAYANGKAEVVLALLQGVEDGTETPEETTGQVLAMLADAWDAGYAAKR